MLIYSAVIKKDGLKYPPVISKRTIFYLLLSQFSMLSNQNCDLGSDLII